METAAIIVAGGRGSRFGSGDSTPKQFLTLGDKPLLRWSVDRFQTAGIDSIVVVVPAGSIQRARDLLSGELVVTEGGETRQDSVASGLEEISTEVVLVHDAARPFVTRALISDVLAELDDHECAIPALPVEETLKSARNGLVEGTIDRDGLWSVQTPQAFRTDALRRAHDKARAEGYVGTDDAALIERYGGKVKVVRGLRTNVKITYPEDLELAEALARMATT